MSLVYDKGKYKYSDIEQIKQRNNIINKKAKLNLNLKKKIKTNSNNNSKLYKEIAVSSPIRNINNNKKNTFLTTYQNYSNITANTKEYANIYNNNKKNKISKKLKYNKSFEGNLLNNDLIFSNNFDFGSDEIYTIPHGKNQADKKFNNNSVILNNIKQNKTKIKKNQHNKSITKTINIHNHFNKNNYKKNNVEENLIITKLDEKFKNLENNIIDKKYENDIDHDEMIISTKKKNENINFQNNNRINATNKINNKILKLSDAIKDINNKNNFNTEDKIENIFMNIFSNKNIIDFDENYLLNSSFENNRNDFNIMYTEHYEESVMEDMLSLEIKLLTEKMLDIQKSYHKELNLIISQYNKNKQIFRILIEKIKSIQKKIYLIKKIQNNKNIKGNIYNFIGIYNQNSQHEINKINKNEFILWKNITSKKDKRFSLYNKEKIKDLFKKTIFDKYNKLSGKINNIENKIILNLMKKYKYFPINKKNNGINFNGSNGDIIIKNDKNKLFTASPIQPNKKIIKQNKNLNSNINNKKKHKKTSSCYQEKPDKYIYFKNSKIK